MNDKTGLIRSAFALDEPSCRCSSLQLINSYIDCVRRKSCRIRSGSSWTLWSIPVYKRNASVAGEKRKDCNIYQVALIELKNNVPLRSQLQKPELDYVPVGLS